MPCPDWFLNGDIDLLRPYRQTPVRCGRWRLAYASVQTAGRFRTYHPGSIFVGSNA
ncbi:hypothetical protein GGR70_000549 [Xanthomonas campestris]|nr:hypothetical protein [Xanthomonas campestris]